MTKTLSDLARTAAVLPGELQKAQIGGVRKSSLVVTRSIRDQIRLATGGDMRMSGVGRSGKKVNARYDVKGSVNPTAFITATGPLQLLDRDTSPHEIRPRKRRKGKRKALRFADGSIRAAARHPGTQGKHVWDKGVARSRGDTQDVFQREIHQAIVRAVK